MIKFSIITVCFNSEKTIEDTILSVLSQDHKDVEYIIIDGNSTDNTISIINKYINSISIFKSDKDLGIYDAINKGIQLSTGDVIGILNSDDIFYGVNVLSKISEKFSTHNHIDIVFSDVLFYDKTTNKSIRYYSSRLFKPFLFRFGFQPAHPTFYVKKKVFNQYGNYDIKYLIASDFDLMLRFLFVHKVKYLYCKDVWVLMLPGGASTSGIKSVININNEIICSCKKNNVFTNYLFVYSKYLFKWMSFIFPYKYEKSD